MGDHQRMTNEQLAAGLAKEVLVAVASHGSGVTLGTNDEAAITRYAKSLQTIYAALHASIVTSMQPSSKSGTETRR
jgi:hypothetical protein